MHKSDRAVKELVRAVRRRFRRRALLRGTAATIFALAAGLAVTAAVYATWKSDGSVLLVGGVLTAALTVWASVAFLLRPGTQRLSDERIALFIEERVPGLEDRLNAAVEAKQLDASGSGAILERLVRDAARKATAVLPETLVSPRRARLLTGAASLLAVALLVVGYRSIDGISAAVLDLPVARPFMTVSPGNVEIERGATQRVLASLRQEPDDDVTIVFRRGDGEWTREAMQQGIGEPTFQREFFNVQESIDYYVEVGDVRSEPFRISMYEFPAVDRIDLTYRFPAYTGLRPRTEEDGGDIVGLRGSRVTVDIRTTGTVEEASLEVDGAGTVHLRSRGDRVFRGEIALDEDGLYTIRLTDREKKTNRFPDRYRIVPIPDEKPRITITDPGRDLRANAIEEVLVAADAEDDYGVTEFRLAYSINGERERSVPLTRGSPERIVAGEYLLFLEDYGLRPGDVISWYLEAKDTFHASGVATDMYFIEIIPFDRQFRQINNVGGGQSGGRPGGLVLSQREIIAATWKLLRGADDMSAARFDESLGRLVRAQTNLKANIEERLASTAFSLELRVDRAQRQVADLLRQATEEMDRATEELSNGDLGDALAPERRALTGLMRANALNKERQVARGQAGSGGGMSATEERMTELMDLELDISKDKYEMQRQASEAGAPEDIDEALRTVKDLARRQQNLAERSRPDELKGDDRRRFVDRLKREQDQLRSRVEELASGMARRGRDRMREGLDRTMRNMRQAERALRREDMDEAMGRQQRALDELERLQRDLERSARGSLRQRAEDLGSDLDALTEREEELGRDIDRVGGELAARGGRLRAEDVQPLEADRQEILRDAEEILSRADDLRKDAGQENQELATTLRNLQQQAQRDRLLDRLLDSREAIRNGWIDSAAEVERDILSALRRLATEREALRGAVPVSDDESLSGALDELRDLQAELERLEDQARRVRQRAQPATRARMQNQMERIRETLSRLREASGPMGDALAGIQSALARADHTGVLLDEETADDFFDENVYAPLSGLETALGRQLDEIQFERKLYGGRREDVPAQYRELVEKYFESLSRPGRRN